MRCRIYIWSGSEIIYYFRLFFSHRHIPTRIHIETTVVAFRFVIAETIVLKDIFDRFIFDWLFVYICTCIIMWQVMGIY